MSFFGPDPLSYFLLSMIMTYSSPFNLFTKVEGEDKFVSVCLFIPHVPLNKLPTQFFFRKHAETDSFWKFQLQLKVKTQMIVANFLSLILHL